MGETDNKSQMSGSALTSGLGTAFGKSLGDNMRSSFDFSDASKAFRDAMPEAGLNVETVVPRYEPSMTPQFEEYAPDLGHTGTSSSSSATGSTSSVACLLGSRTSSTRDIRRR